MTRPIRLLLYGDVDLNVLDGSAVWLTSFAEVLTAHPRVELTVLLKAPEQRDVLSAVLHRLPRTRVVAPVGAGRTRPSAAVDRIEQLDAEAPFGAIVLRGLVVAHEAASRPALAGRLWPYLTDVPQRTSEVTADVREQVGAIAAASELLLCQTPELRDHLESLVPPSERRTALLPPVVPALFHPPAEPSGDRPATELLYAGKFAPLWVVDRLVDAATTVADDGVELTLHVVGDKVHDPADDPGFAPRMRERLEHGPPVRWHGGVSRERVAELLRQVDVAFSVRDPALDDSLELSTKILEYGASGVPVVCNRTAAHERLLGRDYPLFVSGPDELADAVRLVTSDADALRRARERCEHVADAHRPDAVARTLSVHLDRLAPVRPGPRPGRPHRLLVASHELKFLRSYLPWFTRTGVEVRTDTWGNPDLHDEDASREALAWADSVLAEWCLGNATWYAEHRRDDQRLAARLHRVELTTPYPARLAELGADALVTVADHVADELVADHGWTRDALAVIPNAVDPARFDRDKLPSATRTLGVIGCLPRLKRLDRALDLLQTLRRDDDRWQLRVAGALPFDSPWVWARLDERAYFEAVLERIRRSRTLRRCVAFDGPAVDVATWLRRVGVILSPSEVESFHLAVAEGMASGARPVVWDRPGARALFPAAAVVDATPDAADLLRFDDPDAGAGAARFVRERYAIDDVAPRLVEVVLG